MTLIIIFLYLITSEAGTKEYHSILDMVICRYIKNTRGIVNLDIGTAQIFALSLKCVPVMFTNRYAKHI
jgi:hypothetical protein